MNIRKITTFLLAVSLLIQMPFAEAAFRGRNIILESQKLSTDGQLKVSLQLPPHHHFAEDVESSFKILVKDPALLEFKPREKKIDLGREKSALIFNYTGRAGQTVAVLETRVYFCDDINKVCISDFLRIKFRAEISAQNNSGLEITAPLSRPRKG